MSIPASRFYKEYYGHLLSDLEPALDAVRSHCPRGVVFLVGDSTMDNKHWLFGDHKNTFEVQPDAPRCAEAVNGYQDVLDPPAMLQDVAYWVNKEMADRQTGYGCVNGAVEESTVGVRQSGLLPHDEFVRDQLRSEDVLVVSMGGNDIALKATQETQMHLGQLLTCGGSMEQLRAHPSIQYFADMFCRQTQAALEQLTSTTMPSLVVVCMLYFPDLAASGSWADNVLGLMGYDQAPQLLHNIIRVVYQLGSQQVELQGTKLVTLPWFECLDGSDPQDYCQRVEPSSSGGAKMAKALVDLVCAAQSE